MTGKYIECVAGYVLKKRLFNFLFLISIISVIKCVALFFVFKAFLVASQHVSYFPDSGMYERLADNLLSGHGFSLSLSAPFIPTMAKEPLYAFFIALIKSMPFSSIKLGVFIQVLLNPLLAILTYLIGKEIFNEKISRLSALLIALIPIYGEISLFIMPEFIFSVLFSATILFLLKAVNRQKIVWFILSSLLLGLSALCRNVALPLFLIFPAVILLTNGKKGMCGKDIIFKPALFIILFVVVITPWMMRNQRKLNLFSISRRGGEIFSHQAFWAANFSNDEWKAYSLYLISGSLAQKFFQQIIGNDLGEYEYRILMRTPYVEQLSSAYSEGEVEKIMLNSAVKNIIKSPFKFLALSSIIYIQTFKYFESILLMLIKGQAALPFIISLSRFALFILGLLYSMLALKGLFYSRKIFDSSLLITPILYFSIVLTMMGIIPGGIQRHILPVTLFYTFFVVIALDKSVCESS